MKQVKVAATTDNFAALATHADVCIAHDRQTLIVEASWNAQSGSSEGNPELRQVDYSLDPLVTSLRDTLNSQIRASSPGDPLIEKGNQLTQTLFPRGSAAITRASYPDEAVEVERILDEIAKPAWSDVVTAFGLGRITARIQTVAVKYRELLDAPAAEGMKYADVKAKRSQGQSLMLQAMAMVLGKYPSDSEADRQGRALLLGPILRQNEAIGQYLKSRRQVPDVNPDTGEEQPPPPPNP
jgi:hypothetical protein